MKINDSASGGSDGMFMPDVLCYKDSSVAQESKAWHDSAIRDLQFKVWHELWGRGGSR